ncbi:MAG: CoA-binding protein [bacterium]
MQALSSDLDLFFRPRAIAIVGVSTGSYKFGGMSYLHKLQESGYPGELYPVHPKATEIRGLRAYPGLGSLPVVPDLVIVCVPAAKVLSVLRECAAVGARAVHVLTSGFREIGTEAGRGLEEAMASFARQAGLLVMGPNCMGPYCPAARLTPWGAIPGLAGQVGVVSQSGTLTQRITEYLCSLGVGVSKAVSFGNGAVLDGLDFLEFMAEDETIEVITLYLESAPDARRFLALAREVNRRKPIVLWKGGESEAGARAAASHTGSIAGPRHLWNAFFRQTGVTRVESMDELADAVMSFALLPCPRGKGVFLIGGGGGHSVVSGDACVREGLEVPRLSDETLQRLKDMVPAVGSIAGNPLDHWRIYEDADQFARIVELGCQDPAIDMIVADRIIPRSSFHMSDEQDSTSAVIELMERNRNRKPTVFVVDSAGADPDLALRGCSVRARLCKAGLPAFPNLRRALRALAHLHRYPRVLARGPALPFTPE